jgi:hypothetical protein
MRCNQAAVDDIAIKMLDVKPTTLAGMKAIMDYAA